MRRLPVEVSLGPGPGRGRTVVDRRLRVGESEIHEGPRERPLVDVALGADVARFVELYLEAVEREGRGPSGHAPQGPVREIVE